MSAATRLRVSHGGRGSRSEKNWLYSASSCLRPAESVCKSFWTSVSSATAITRSARCRVLGVPSSDQKPEERQPEFASVRHRLVVNQHVRRVEAPDEVEEITKRDDILRKEPRAVTATIAGADLAVLGGGARHLDGACV